MTTASQNLKPKGWNIFFFLLLVWVVLMLFSRCNPAKQIQRKDDAAVNRVNASAPLQARVVGPYLDAHPQDTTTKIIVSDPKIITVQVPKLVTDTTGRKRLIDSVIKANQDTIGCEKAAKQAYELGYDECEKYYLSHPIKANCPPDTTKQIQLTSEIARINDSLNLYKQKLSFSQGQSADKDTQITEDKKSLSTKNWLIFGLIAASGVSLFFNVKSLLKNVVNPLKKL